MNAYVGSQDSSLKENVSFQGIIRETRLMVLIKKDFNFLDARGTKFCL